MALGTEKTQFEMNMLKAETKTLLWKENKDGKKHPKKKDDKQQRDRDEGGERNQQTRRDVKRL